MQNGWKITHKLEVSTLKFVKLLSLLKIQICLENTWCQMEPRMVSGPRVRQT